MLEFVDAWPGAAWLRQSSTAYLFVNATHILGIGVLLGGILPLDLRLLGFFRRFPVEVLGPFLSRSAGVGLGLAIVTGLWLFSVKPAEYLANDAFRVKLVLLVIALGNVAFLRMSKDAFQPSTRTRIAAALSLGLWVSVLVAGRWTGFL